eukprot:TRINITY_DN111243_c0_g1_i1.p1 TRINITY_DN111243_c0_g1~~TRINITY_DN111243_c0_g1_i1.p1  ORF type:complete len:292 (-),score=35.54 TRINITY_DN111243_c0_g1_i1:76-951(-)
MSHLAAKGSFEVGHAVITSPRSLRVHHTNSPGDIAYMSLKHPHVFALARTGVKITSNEEMAISVAPASSSPHETALHNIGKPSRMKMLDELQHSLAKDKARETTKYGGAPSVAAARFSVELPASPQHQKYSWWDTTRRFEAHGQHSYHPVCHHHDPGQSHAASDQIASLPSDLDRSPKSHDNSESGGDHSPASRKPVDLIIFTNRFKMDSILRFFEEMEPVDGLVPRRAIVVKMMNKVVAASGAHNQEGEIFSYLKKKVFSFTRDHSLDKDSYIECVRDCGLLLEYQVGSE